MRKPHCSELPPRLCFAEHDAISHFLLRVLCCGDGAATHWLLEAEEMGRRLWRSVEWGASERVCVFVTLFLCLFICLFERWVHVLHLLVFWVHDNVEARDFILILHSLTCFDLTDVSLFVALLEVAEYIRRKHLAACHGLSTVVLCNISYQNIGCATCKDQSSLYQPFLAKY